MNRDLQAEQAELLRRLNQQRHHIRALFVKPEPANRVAEIGEGNFPRSQTMRLLVKDPMFKSALGALAVYLLGPRAMQLLRAAASAFRVGANITRQ